MIPKPLRVVGAKGATQTLFPHFADRKLRITGVSGFARLTLGGRAEVRIQVWVTPKLGSPQEARPPPLP